MKIAVVDVDCCRECPFADKTKHPMIKYCGNLDREVIADEIDDDCPLDEKD